MFLYPLKHVNTFEAVYRMPKNTMKYPLFLECIHLLLCSLWFQSALILFCFLLFHCVVLPLRKMLLSC